MNKFGYDYFLNNNKKNQNYSYFDNTLANSTTKY